MAKKLAKKEVAAAGSIGNAAGTGGMTELLDAAVIHDVVQSIKRNLKVDWTAEHRSDVQAAVNSAVKQTLRKRGDDFEPMIVYIMKQAEDLSSNWPVVAA